MAKGGKGWWGEITPSPDCHCVVWATKTPMVFSWVETMDIYGPQSIQYNLGKGHCQIKNAIEKV